MEHQYKVCCGLDVHKKLLVACLRTGLLWSGCSQETAGCLSENRTQDRDQRMWSIDKRNS